jgi:2-C-methyl-D-erythritol 4-phosphate cytidylyltransferase
VSSTAAVIVAAGSGERLGAGVPKALVPLAGEPLLIHAVRAFAAVEAVKTIVIVAGLDHLDAVRAALPADLADRVDACCAGGRTRAESVDRGLQSLPAGADVVAVHDAARPLVSSELIARAVAALEPGWDAVAPAMPVVDTLKLADGERVVRTVDRRGLFGVQTPQVFGRITIERLHADHDPAAAEATDDLVLVEEAGGQVRLIPGELTNLKVTYPDDLRLAEALLAAGVGG